MTTVWKATLFAVLRNAFALLCISTATAVSQGSLLLVGGGSEDYNDWSDAPYRWLVNHAPNRRILVLNYADTTDFFSGYFPWLSPCTVTNLAIISPAQANDSVVFKRILEFDGIFLRGGDQSQYVSLWRYTLTERAIQDVYRRGGVIGGTSAGAMILGDVVYDARVSSTEPRDALRNPLGPSLTFTEDFLGLLPRAIIDSHFFERGRLGRLPAFLARYMQSAGREIAGIGVEYGTALAIGPDSIGEVMGSGTVTILRTAPETYYSLEAGKQLSMRNIRFDQLTAGARLSFSTGESWPPIPATPYAAMPFSLPSGTVVLDGSGSIGDWAGESGSLKTIQAALAKPTDTIGIIASPAGQGAAFAVGSALVSSGSACRFLSIGESAMNDTSFASALSGCGGLVFAGNSADSLSRFLDTSTVAGRAFSSQIAQGKPVALLGDDTGLAGDEGIAQMYRNIYGAYYGYLRLVGGVHVLKGLQCVSRLFEQSDYVDNRSSSVFWSMAEDRLPFGLLLDQGTHVTISGNQIRIFGSTPVILIDARDATWASVPDWRDPGKVNPRQIGGILGATMHVMRDGEMFDLSATSGVDRPHGQGELAASFLLDQNYPNPFNPSTVIRYHLPVVSIVKLAVYDILGREVAVLVDGRMMAAGAHDAVFTAAGCASGVYFYRLQAGDLVQTRKLVVLR